jgi:hypothetical protein
MIYNTSIEITNSIKNNNELNVENNNEDIHKSNDIDRFISTINEPNNFYNMFMFDAKYITFDYDNEYYEIYNYVLWKHSSFGHNDLINKLAKKYISKKNRNNMSQNEITSLLQEKYGKYFTDDYMNLMNGLFLKYDKNTKFYTYKNIVFTLDFLIFLITNKYNNTKFDENFSEIDIKQVFNA